MLKSASSVSDLNTASSPSVPSWGFWEQHTFLKPCQLSRVCQGSATAVTALDCGRADEWLRCLALDALGWVLSVWPGNHRDFAPAMHFQVQPQLRAGSGC